MVVVFIEVVKLGGLEVCAICGEIIIVCFGYIEFEVLLRY